MKQTQSNHSIKVGQIYFNPINKAKARIDKIDRNQITSTIIEDPQNNYWQWEGKTINRTRHKMLDTFFWQLI